MTIRGLVSLSFASVALLFGAACTDSSDELAALKRQVKDLQQQVNAASPEAPATPRAPATTRASVTTHTFTDAEASSLQNMCPTFPANSCDNFISKAVGAGVYGSTISLDPNPPNPGPRLCNYNEVKAWINSKKYDDPEWPIFVERECGPYRW